MSKKVVNGILHDKLDEIEKLDIEEMIEEEIVDENSEDESLASQLSVDNTLCDASVDEESTCTPQAPENDHIFEDLFAESDRPERESCVFHTLQLVVKVKDQIKI